MGRGAGAVRRLDVYLRVADHGAALHGDFEQLRGASDRLRLLARKDASKIVRVRLACASNARRSRVALACKTVQTTPPPPNSTNDDSTRTMTQKPNPGGNRGEVLRL